jgi:tRNA dimethylallyltransferase
MTRSTGTIPVIIGPTAGGKTALALACAAAFARAGCSAEIISADSVQVFRGLDIGSAKPSAEERLLVPHHLIDIVEPGESFTVHDWLVRAEEAIEGARTRGVRPMVVGGTHLYIKALVDGLFEGPMPDPDLRRALDERDLASLRSELASVDPRAAVRIHPADRRRTIRALEVFHQVGIPMSDLQQQWDREHPRRTDLRLIALHWPTESINRRINARVRDMMEAGLLEEVRNLLSRLGPSSAEALGYAQLAAHLRGESTLEDAVERTKIETRRFAKSQRTWLKRLSGYASFRWIEAESMNIDREAQDIVNNTLMS